MKRIAIYELTVPNNDTDIIQFPDGLHTVEFRDDVDNGHKFSQKLNNVRFQDSLHTLRFGICLNHILDDIKFPSNLHTIIFGDRFNQNIDNIIFPDSLHSIIFTYDFNQKIDNIKFPKNLHYIKFGPCFNEDIACLNDIYTLEKINVHHSWKKCYKLPYECVLERYHG